MPYGIGVSHRAGLFIFDDVVVERAGVRALDGLSAALPVDGVSGIAGPSGSGKSTMLRLCNRLEVPTSGCVLFHGEDVAGLDPLRLRRRVGMVFQRPTPFPGTVRDNLVTAAPDAGRAELEQALRRAALDPSYLERDATALSGGEAQRVCMARTLITEPDVLLLDEPTSALDDDTARTFETAVVELSRGGVTVIWVSHAVEQLKRVADTVLRIEHGQCVGADPGDTGAGEG